MTTLFPNFVSKTKYNKYGWDLFLAWNERRKKDGINEIKLLKQRTSRFALEELLFSKQTSVVDKTDH